MHPDTRNIAGHMREFGLALLGHALKGATFSECANAYAHAISVVTAANAAEILIKARIAEEHPLLIFTKLPHPDPAQLLDIDALMEKGRTLMYEDLPSILWAATGYRINLLEQYKKFGRLRNTITHLAVPDEDLSAEVYHFIFQVLEPIVWDFWKEDIIGYYEDLLEEEEYVAENLQRLNIAFIRRAQPK